ncbi:MAG: hypothetical protein A2315_08425 [Ignavibacteria bacterium RIFOXYB2_FULL_35_12]|nr:MAG: hypothetical protein A2006_04485 [Ignavibacteria bacterium GWC2_35_8]OGU59787.1 MAG: hypothetical protein A2X60_10535 [Ignavibacteria bacterium GWF2_35_20]OGU78743.1 MAG: hypothetical protein A2254_00405 [Ignavibacteria bacterium RIFOXYA2_FULL_35_9]OGU85255.1 MAG: hypothetical protein A3K31_11995 [Ignavibacteria bacterium RIFOXYA12_FULL_35_25]OGU91735.1 MAG: hypothetical protein A2492_07115 [Ignavibacteria bacterium RIFOXYC12_FULL_35_11]OGU97392.1 MAG: hypothetical protein A2347_15045 
MKSKSFKITCSPESLKQIKKIKKSESQAEVDLYFARIKELIENIQDFPFTGIGKPEPLKHRIPPCWSRRINLEDRLIYRISKNEIQIISILEHYNK